MPSIPLLSELGAKADKFQQLLNEASIPNSVSNKLGDYIEPSDLFGSTDSRIFVRARPIIEYDGESDMTEATIVQHVQGKKDAVLMAPKISVSGQMSLEPTPIALDRVFVGGHTTEDVYFEACASLVEFAATGASTCILCYGQTGSGKTFTTSGLMRCMAEDLCTTLDNNSLYVTVIEIQSNQNVDLLTGKTVQICEDNHNEVQLLGARSMEVSSVQELLHAVDLAASARSTKATARNLVSSRSHMVVRFSIVSKTSPWAKPGMLFVADLAGSESTADSATHDKTRQLETKFINTSLMTLKDCVRNRTMAGSSAKHVHIPYRQSALTLLLRDCFELAVKRPTKTAVIACVSPLLKDVRHTSNTLRYASLLAVAPPPRVVQESKDDPSSFDREQCMEFLKQITNSRIDPSIILPEGDGRALTHIPEAEFLARCKNGGLSGIISQRAYGALWKKIVDSRTSYRKNVLKVSKDAFSKDKENAPAPTAAAPPAARKRTSSTNTATTSTTTSREVVAEKRKVAVGPRQPLPEMQF